MLEDEVSAELRCDLDAAILFRSSAYSESESDQRPALETDDGTHAGPATCADYLTTVAD